MREMLPMTVKHSLLQLDLNLLVALDAVLAEQHVTRAAHRMGISQSGMSRTLARLRGLFDDPLLVNGEGGLVLTPRAERLREPVASCLKQIDALVQPESFDPASEAGPLRVMMPDHLALLMGPPLLSRLAAEAPGVDLIARGFGQSWRRDLLEGRVDLAFGVLGEGDGSLRARHVLDDDWVVLLREDHPASAGRWTKKRFAGLDHGLMTVDGSGPGHVDRALARHGLERRVRYRTSSPVVIAMMASQTDLAVTTTRLLARWLTERFELTAKPLPFEAEPLRLPLVWPERLQHDPRHRYFRELFAGVAAEL